MMKIVVLHGNDVVGPMRRMTAFLNEDIFRPGSGYKVVRIGESGWPWWKPSDYLDEIVRICQAKDGCQIFFYGDGPGHELAVRLGVRLGIPCVLAADRIESGGIVRRVYSSYLEEYYPVDVMSLIVSVNPSGIKNKDISPMIPVDAVMIESQLYGGCDSIVRLNESMPCPENGLTDADIVFVGGKGLQSKENYELMKSVAAYFGAGCGITRPGALSGWDSVSRIVGQSGCSISPGLCIAIGVSGAAPFMSGIEHAGRLIAINTDEDAPIFKYADEGMTIDGPGMLRYLAGRIKNDSDRSSV